MKNSFTIKIKSKIIKYIKNTSFSKDGRINNNNKWN